MFKARPLATDDVRLLTLAALDCQGKGSQTPLFVLRDPRPSQARTVGGGGYCMYEKHVLVYLCRQRTEITQK